MAWETNPSQPYQFPCPFDVKDSQERCGCQTTASPHSISAISDFGLLIADWKTVLLFPIRNPHSHIRNRRVGRLPRLRRFSLLVLSVFASLLLSIGASGCKVSRQQAQQRNRIASQAMPSPSVSPGESPLANESDAINRPTSPPYKGSLSVFEDPERAEKLQVERVMDILGIREGAAVADIGAGSGWFTVRAARRVGASGVVYAEDINSDYVKYVERRVEKEKLTNVRSILGKEDDPLLPEMSVDAVLLLKTYHEVAQPIRLLKHVRVAMRPGGRLGIIDRNGQGDDHGINADVVIKEAERAGFTLANQFDFVKADNVDYFLVFSAISRP